MTSPVEQFFQSFLLPGIRHERLWRWNADAFKPGSERDGRLMMFGFAVRGWGPPWLLRLSRVVAGGCSRSGLAFTEQCHQIRLKAGAIVCRMPKQEFDQPSFACAKMAVHPPSGEAMKQGNRLLGEKVFEFFRSHGNSSKTPRRKTAIACDAQSARAGCVSLRVWSCERNSKVRASSR